MISSLKTANYRCFPLITGKPVRLENRKKFSAVKILSATRCKKPFLDSSYGFCWRGGWHLKKSYLNCTSPFKKSLSHIRSQSYDLLRKFKQISSNLSFQNSIFFNFKGLKSDTPSAIKVTFSIFLSIYKNSDIFKLCILITYETLNNYLTEAFFKIIL